jgi:DNA repair exonuclease SbcCD ATPase subunit
MAVVPVILKLLAQKAPGLTSALSEVRKDFGDLASLVDTVKLKAAGFTLATTVGIASLGGQVVKQAGEFEQLQARMLSVAKTAEGASAAFQNAIELASNSPFDVKGVVAATVQLEAFGQRSKELLPLVGNLAAAFGKPIEEGAQVLGKAFSGSLEGFESLRNTYGISTALLVRYGATMAKTGGIAVSTASDLQKARQALTQIIQTRYGDAMERQSRTLFGAFSNLEDAVSRFAAAFGTALIPLATTITRALTAVVESFEQIPAPFRTLIALGGVATVTIGALATAVLGVVGLVGNAIPPLVSMGRAMGSLGGTSAATAGEVTVTVLATERMGVANAAASETVVNLARVVTGAGIVQQAFNAELTYTSRALTGLTGQLPALTAEVALYRQVTSGASIGTAQLALGAGKAGPQLALATAGVQNLAVATPQASTGLANLAARTDAATRAGGVFAGLGLGPVLLGIGAVAGGATLALANMHNQNERLNQSVEQSARIFQDAVRGLRQMQSFIEQLTGKQAGYVRGNTTAAEAVAAFKEQLNEISPAELLDRLEKAGKSIQDLRDELKLGTEVANKQAAEIARIEEEQSRLNKTIELYKALMKSGFSDQVNTQELDEAGSQLEINQERLDTLRSSFQRTSKENSLKEELIPRLEATSKAFEAASEHTQQFSAYLSSVGRTDSIPQVNRAIELTNQRLQQVRKDLEGQGLPLNNLVALRERLLNANPKEQQAINDLLKLEDARVDLVKKREDLEQAGVREKIRQADLAIERENVRLGESLTRERERVAAQLNLVRSGSEEELSIRKRLASLDDRIRTDKVTKARDAFETEQGALRDGLDALRGSGEASAEEIAGAIEQIILKTEAWQAANKGILAQSPDLTQSVSGALRGLRRDLDSATRAIPKERVDEALAAAKELGTEAINAEQKLAAATKGIEQLRALQASGEITTTRERARLQSEINKLTNEELKLRTEVAKEERAQARETDALRRGGLETELELLKVRQEQSGQDLSSQIRDKEQQILAEKLQAIREQEQAEIDSGVNATRARERAEIRITQLKNEETLKRMQAESDLTGAVESEAKKQEDIRKRYQDQRLGGPNSPLKSLAEVSEELQMLGAFDLGSGFGRSRSNARQSPPSGLFEVQRQIESDITSGDRVAGRGQRGRYTDAINAAERTPTFVAPDGPGTPAAGTVNNYYVSLQNRALDVNDPASQQAVKQLVGQFITEAQHRGVA